MKHLLRRFALGAVVMVVIIGCGGSPSTPSSASSEATASSSALAGPSLSAAVPSSAVTTSPSTIATASSPAGPPSLTGVTSKHADPALEAQLPAVVSGTALERWSFAAPDSGGDRASLDAFLQAIGKSESDASFGYAFDPTYTMTGGILAIKVSGADTATLLGGIVPVTKSDLGAGATTRQATVGGKNVTIVSVGTGPNDTEWIYGRGDIVFDVHADDETRAAAFLQALP